MIFQLQKFKAKLWNSLENIYRDYLKCGSELSYDSVKAMILENVSRDPIGCDILMNMIYRMDMNANGKVDFVELGNFLIKGYCRQVSLQKYHRKKVLNGGSNRFVLSSCGFKQVIDDAFSFLSVVIPSDLSQYLYEEADTNCDGQVSYQEFFQITRDSFCKPDPCVVPVKPKPKIISNKHLKLHVNIWSSLQRIFEAHVKGRSIQATETQIYKLFISITGEISTYEKDFIKRKFFKLDIKIIQFKQFASHFLYILGDLGLNRFSNMQGNTSKTLSLSEFIKVVSESYSFADIEKFKGKVLEAMYKKISVNGKLTFSQFLHGWVKKYICEFEYTEEEYYVEVDDGEKNPDPCEILPSPEPISPNTFKFSDYSLSNRVRSKTYRLLGSFDRDRNQEFSKCEIKEALTSLFDATSSELFDTANSYDLDHDGEVTYEELTDFVVKEYFGLITVQREHRKGFFCRGDDLKMNQRQFKIILSKCLEYIAVVTSDYQLSQLWKAINSCGSTYISYSLYFTFLEYYFGAHCPCKPPAPDRTKCETEYQIFLRKYKCLSPRQRFAGILIDQFKVIFDYFDTNKNGRFEKDEIRQFLRNVFKFSCSQADRVIRKLGYCYSMTYDQFINQFLNVYFERAPCGQDIAKDGIPSPYSVLTKCQFVERILNGCYFLRFKPLKSDLEAIFDEIKGCREYIFFYTYVLFIKGCLGGKEEKDDKKEDKKWDFDFDLSNQFCQAYKRVLEQTYIELKSSKWCRCNNQLRTWQLIEWLRDTFNYSLCELSKRFNLKSDKYDPNEDKIVTLHQFNSFMMIHQFAEQFNIYNSKVQGAIANEMSEQDFKNIMKQSLSFYSGFYWHWSYTLKEIFDTLSCNGKLSSAKFRYWHYSFINN